MNVVWHYHEAIDIDFGIKVVQCLDDLFHRFAERIQDTLFAHYRPKHALVMKHLKRNKEPSVSVIDPAVPKLRPPILPIN